MSVTVFFSYAHKMDAARGIRAAVEELALAQLKTKQQMSVRSGVVPAECWRWAYSADNFDKVEGS